MDDLNSGKIDQGVFDLYDQYAHNKISRREFTERIGAYAVGGLTVTALLEKLLPNYGAIQIPSDDPRIDSEYIEYESPEGGGTIRALLARPSNTTGPLPGVIVVHENRGLNPYIEDVTRRAALAGYLAIGPDALWPLGGYPGNDDEGRAMQRQREKSDMLEDFIAAHGYLASLDGCTGKVGVVGFCFGGWISNMLAVRVQDLNAAVPFYGRQPEATDVPRINAPLMFHFGELDTRVNEGWPAFEKALIDHDKQYVAHMYPEANHGFHNDTTPRYDKKSAELAWSRTLEFFSTHLR